MAAFRFRWLDSGSANLRLAQCCVRNGSHCGKNTFPLQSRLNIFRRSAAAAVNVIKMMFFLSMPEQSINCMLFLQEMSHVLVDAFNELAVNTFLCKINGFQEFLQEISYFKV